MARNMKVNSLAAHAELANVRDRFRRQTQGSAFITLARLELVRDVRQVDAAITELEELLARIPDELPIPKGHRKLRLGAFSMDLVISSKVEMQRVLEVFRERRKRLVGSEGEGRLAAAEALEAHLIAGERAAPDERHGEAQAGDDEPSGNGHDPSSPWG